LQVCIYTLATQADSTVFYVREHFETFEAVAKLSGKSLMAAEKKFSEVQSRHAKQILELAQSYG
jgi:hypothetical protein